MPSFTGPHDAATGLGARIPDLILPIAVVASILVILVPMPAGLMDLLLAANITIAVIMLLTTLYVRTPLEFSVFPSLLLATTLFRLVLNVATTRLILTRAGSDHLLAAGGVVRTFGEFVTGGSSGSNNIVVGLVIFSIIVLIQFVVITKGTTRISEVAARFTLDGMPGKQMAIDADLNAGLIDQYEAQRRRREVAQQADFFGAMDGASKFVRGDAVAGIAIILINIVGGLFIGVIQNGMSLAEAGSLFTTLTIGDGLVTQVPAFLISMAAGMLVTRSSQESSLPKEFIRQLFSRPIALAVAGAFLGILVFTSLPRIPLTLLGSACIALAVVLSRRETKLQAAQAKKQVEASRRSQQRVEDYLAVDPLEIELGVGLLRLADPKRGGDLLDRIQRVRQLIASDLGVILPKVRIRDNMRLEPNQYRIKIADVAVARGAIVDRSLDPGNTVTAHFTETVRQHADELLTRDAVKHLIEEVKKNSPAAIDELIPTVMKIGEVQQTLQLLLREGVSLRPLGAILEALADYAVRIKDPMQLAERVRQRLNRTICRRYCDQENRLRVITLDPDWEQRILDAMEISDHGIAVRLGPSECDYICGAIEAELPRFEADRRPPVLLVNPQVRPAVRQVASSRLPQLVVLSFAEISRDIRIESLAMVGKVADGLPVGLELASPHFPSVTANSVS